ncbi:MULTISPECIES: NUDIX hydrolase [unclassified Nocardioides]|uniref:NUDIX hydrolase n=1 Tax=unclassified Nocardioides TaxID=2615069 RepID=UPI0030144631
MRETLHRTCARVLPVNASGQVLLLHGWDPKAPKSPYWFTVGGGLEEGETLTAAAVREMLEETGQRITEAELSAPLGTEDVAFDWGDWHLVQRQTYYAVRLDDAGGVHLGGLEPLETGTIDTWGWWTPDALDADGSAAGASLTDMMRAAIVAVLGGDT